MCDSRVEYSGYFSKRIRVFCFIEAMLCVVDLERTAESITDDGSLWRGAASDKHGDPDVGVLWLDSSQLYEKSWADLGMSP
jgi:hypothetical protein